MEDHRRLRFKASRIEVTCTGNEGHIIDRRRPHPIPGSAIKRA